MAIKQKIEIKVQVECKNTRQQAMKIASLTDGVENVGVEGDKLVITGTGIYWVRLLKSLEKKLGCIQLLTLAEVKPPPPPPDPKPKPKQEPPPPPPPPCSHPPPMCIMVDSPCSDPCSIM
ncbi:heavy metal-associated isoprenylated plant protein 2-like [Ananas comosus]|uniref:Heavy metal-associated isoprenylated plant protein 2-like n=1 Tax=Ananas comosus TaxID=4615 RepID=A0A6P5GYF5_ANACO|nr:heavy metal-associated isoprenylated plant protein 2-like [Ananas comosus]